MNQQILRLADGHVAAFVESGTRPTVVLLHGNSCCKEIFINQIATLRHHGFGILAPDLPGHGASADARTPTRTYSFPGYASVIGQLLEKLHLGAVHVVGWSLGGHIGLEMLATDPRVRSLLIVGTPPIRLEPADVERAFLPSPAMSLTGKRVLTPREARVYGECMLGGRRFLAPHLLRAIRRTDGRARHWMVRNGLSGVGSDEVVVVETMRKPLAVLHGRHDAFVNSDYLKSLNYRNLWRGSIQCLEAGHAPHWQRPRLFNKLLLAYLDTIS